MVSYTIHAPIDKKRRVMTEFVDTHTHLFCPEFDDDRHAVVARAVEAGVERLCLPCIDSSSITPMLDMCNKFPAVCYPMIGLHPTEVKSDYHSQLEQMHALLSIDKRFIAIGEVGLDFYWDDSCRHEQIAAFEEQIGWAEEHKLPLVIHSRNAFEELYAIMERNRSRSLTGIFHCFSGSADEACKLLSFDGFALGIGGVLTYKKSTLPDVLKEAVPLERIVLETDSPYLSPVPHRGKRNESAHLVHVAQKLSRIYDLDIEQVARVTTHNAEQIFTKI